MSLHLDARQRAMLQEMGVHVWSPAPPANPGPVSSRTDDAAATPARVATLAPSAAATPYRTAAPTSAAPAAATLAATTTASTPDNGSSLLPQLQPPQPLYTAANAATSGPTWLIVAENQPGTDPLANEAGALLNNMLQALQLHQAPQRVFFCGVALSNSGFVQALHTPAHSILSDYLAQIQPAMVLLMGRLAARAVLGRNEPLGQLRALPHHLGPYPAIVTYEASYLLRHGKYKAAAWADLCRARALLQASQG